MVRSHVQIDLGMNYLTAIAEKQAELDHLIRMHDGLPVGGGYIDIIVGRERSFDLIDGLTAAGFAVEVLSWWCHATERNKMTFGCPHGYGGPVAPEGYYSELCHDFDEASNDEIRRLDSEERDACVRSLNERMKGTIRTKTTTAMADGVSLSFQSDGCLRPGIWVKVPQTWSR